MQVGTQIGLAFNTQHERGDPMVGKLKIFAKYIANNCKSIELKEENDDTCCWLCEFDDESTGLLIYESNKTTLGFATLAISLFLGKIYNPTQEQLLEIINTSSKLWRSQLRLLETGPKSHNSFILSIEYKTTFEIFKLNEIFDILNHLSAQLKIFCNEDFIDIFAAPETINVDRLKQAAGNDDSDAAYTLGRLYCAGNDAANIEVNLDIANHYLKISENLVNKAAAKFLKKEFCYIKQLQEEA